MVFIIEGRVAELVIAEQAMSVPMAEDALENAVRQHARLVYRISYSVLRDHHEAEDATQETFLRVLRHCRRLEGVSDPRSWLARIAWRVAVGRRKRRPDLAGDAAPEAAEHLPSSFATAEETLLGGEMERLLHRLIVALPEKLRDPLTLSTLEEMSPADVAAVLNITEAVVRSRLFRARQILKEKLTTILEGPHGS